MTTATADTVPQKTKMSKFLRVIKWLFAIGFVLGLILAVCVFIYVVRATKDLPTLETLKQYKPPVMSFWLVIREM